MSEQEKFLARWSRRKREAADEVAADQEPETAPDKSRAGEAVEKESAAASPKADAKPAPGFDLASLPSLESIGPNSDIRAFLQPGVPGALSRAALRRAWSVDPAIRDFVGLAENSWDFTANNPAIGFGPLDLDPREAARQLAKVFGEEASEAEAGETQPAPTTQISQSVPQDAALARSGAETLPAAGENPASKAEEADDASQQSEPEGSPPATFRRGHGGALPE